MTVEELIEKALRQTCKPMEMKAADIIRDQRQLIEYLTEQLSETKQLLTIVSQKLGEGAEP